MHLWETSNCFCTTRKSHPSSFNSWKEFCEKGPEGVLSHWDCHPPDLDYEDPAELLEDDCFHELNLFFEESTVSIRVRARDEESIRAWLISRGATTC